MSDFDDYDFSDNDDDYESDNNYEQEYEDAVYECEGTPPAEEEESQSEQAVDWDSDLDDYPIRQAMAPSIRQVVAQTAPLTHAQVSQLWKDALFPKIQKIESVFSSQILGLLMKEPLNTSWLQSLLHDDTALYDTVCSGKRHCQIQWENDQKEIQGLRIENQNLQKLQKDHQKLQSQVLQQQQEFQKEKEKLQSQIKQQQQEIDGLRNMVVHQPPNDSEEIQRLRGMIQQLQKQVSNTPTSLKPLTLAESIPEISPSDFICHKCQNPFPSRNALHRHLPCKPYKCKECEAPFVSKKELQEHLKESDCRKERKVARGVISSDTNTSATTTATTLDSSPMSGQPLRQVRPRLPLLVAKKS